MQMKHQLRSAVCTEGRRMAGARALWVAAGMKHEQFGKPIIAIVNSFTQFVPGQFQSPPILQQVTDCISWASLSGRNVQGKRNQHGRNLVQLDLGF